jgi:hypothetical protein
LNRGRAAFLAKQLVEVALRVLAAWVDGREPLAADVNMLKTAHPGMAYLPPDELACQVIHDLNTVCLNEAERHRVDDCKVERVA